MPRLNNDIAEEFSKALEKAAYPDMQKYLEDPEARAGSDDLKTIEMLYGVKLQQDLINEYADNIMQAAHPTSYIASPAYDPINGLVENNIERHNIMVNIVNKQPYGTHDNHKYAKQQLTMELIRIANEMDAKNKETLYKLADECLEEISKKGFLEALPAVFETLTGPVGWVLGGATILGALWLSQHTEEKDNGALANTDRAIAALKDLSENSWYESDVDPFVQKAATDLIQHLTKLRQSIEKFNGIQSKLTKPRTLSEANELVKLQQEAKTKGDFAKEAVKQFKQEVLEVLPEIEDNIKNFSSEAYRKQHTKPSLISDLTGFVGDLVHSDKGLFGDDYVAAVNALKPLKTSLQEMSNSLENFDQVVSHFKDQIQSSEAFMNAKYKPKANNEVKPISYQDLKDDVGADKVFNTIMHGEGEAK